MKQFIYLAIIIFIATTIFIGIKSMDGHISAGGLGFIFLAVSPYAYLAILNRRFSGKTPIIVVLVLSIIVGGFGIWAFIDSMVIQTDAQAGMAFIVVPVYQWFFLLLSTLPVYFLYKKKVI